MKPVNETCVQCKATQVQNLPLMRKQRNFFNCECSVKIGFKCGDTDKCDTDNVNTAELA